MRPLDDPLWTDPEDIQRMEEAPDSASAALVCGGIAVLLVGAGLLAAVIR